MRFAGFVAMAFITAFVGISWAARGFPVGYPTIVARPLRTEVSAQFGVETPKDPAHEAWAASVTSESEKDAGRNVVRLEALQAANAYGLSPCDPTIKANLVKALTAYTEAYMKVLDCRVLMSCPRKTMETAWAAFATPLDKRVRTALDEAFSQGGISITKDFPERMHLKMPMLMERTPISDPPTCVVPNRAARNGR